MRPAHIGTVLDNEFLSARAGEHTPAMLWGAPGVGKSDLVRQCGRRHQVHVIDIRLSQMEPSDLRGIPFRQGPHVEWAIPSMLPDSDRHGQYGILFLDELTSAVPSVSAAAYQLILDRCLGDYQVPTGWCIFAAGNRLGDRGISYTMPAPLANRFSHYTVEINLDDWVTWAYRRGIDERIISFLRFRPDLLFQFDPAQNPIAFPSPRSWEFVHRALVKFDAHPDLLLGTLQSCIGDAAGVELNAFIDSLDRLPDVDAIVAGEPLRPPNDIDLQYALATALVSRALSVQKSGKHKPVVDRLLGYAESFPQREMGVMLVSDLARALGEDVYTAPSFAPWAESVGDILLYQ